MIELSRLPAEGLRLDGAAAALPLEKGEAFRDARWTLRILPSNQDFYLEIVGQAVWESYCSRCLEPFEREVRLESRFLGSKDPDLVARGSHTSEARISTSCFSRSPCWTRRLWYGNSSSSRCPCTRCAKMDAWDSVPSVVRIGTRAGATVGPNWRRPPAPSPKPCPA